MLHREKIFHVCIDGLCAYAAPLLGVDQAVHHSVRGKIPTPLDNQVDTQLLPSDAHRIYTLATYFACWNHLDTILLADLGQACREQVSQSPTENLAVFTAAHRFKRQYRNNPWRGRNRRLCVFPMDR